MTRYDIAVIGTGPAGVSAAITAKIRNKTVLLLGKSTLTGKLVKAHRIDNYPGFPQVKGEELAAALTKHLEVMEIPITEDRITAVYAMGDFFGLQGASGEMYEARSVILATGVDQAKTFPGEAEFLGSGVSYCATCDAPLYKGKTAAVIADSPKEEAEAAFLSEVCEKVLYFPLYKDEPKLPANVEVIKEAPKAIEAAGLGRKSVVTEGGSYTVNGVFVLREAIAAGQLVPGLVMDGAHVAADRQMKTSIAGLFAAGDITGRPYQYIKAAGEGNVAALSAVDFLK